MKAKKQERTTRDITINFKIGSIKNMAARRKSKKIMHENIYLKKVKVEKILIY